MKRLHFRAGGLLFWIFFGPYVLGVVIFLAAGLAPSVAKEWGAVHDALHEYADDALLAGSTVTIEFESLDPARTHRIVIVGPERGQPVLASRVVPAGGRATLQFVAPPPGSYRMTSPGHPELEGEIRFADDGARTVSIRLTEAEHRFQRVGEGGLSAVARRVADASHRADHGARVTLESLFSVLNLGLGLVLIARRPRDRTARLLAVAMIGTAVTFNHQSHSTVRDYLIGDWWFPHDLFHILSGVAYMYAVIVFPDGRLLPLQSRRRWLLRVAYGVATLVLAVNVLDRTSVGHPGQSFFTVLFGVLIPLVGVAAQTYRLRHATDPIVQQQSRLLRLALLPMFVAGVIYLVLTQAFDTAWVEDVGLAVFPALFALVPLALVMGILRYRLWDIDVLVSRTLMSVGLAAFIGFVYVVVVVVLGHGLGPGGSAGLKIVATAIAAIAFEPVRERLARFANRLVYGERATPYEVMAAFSDRLAGAISVDEILPRIAETTVNGIGGVAAQVTAFLPGGGTRTVEWPETGNAAGFSFVMPVAYRGEQVGEIAVATAHGERLRPEEEELLAALGAQAGLAVNNARLTIELQARLEEISVQAADLRASRQRIVTARQGQRQRVVQLIHERVEVRLLRASDLLDELAPVLTTDVAHALELIEELVDECGEALDALRELARGIFPAILADQGVVSALEAYVLQAHLPIDVRVQAMDAPDRYDPQAEAIVYFCVIQALTNAGEYAPESSVVVRLCEERGLLSFSVADDGPGADLQRLQAGADVRDMRDRVEAVGGQFDATAAPRQGTVISGSVPVRTE
jgi:signal transduction histidine kinase